MCVCVRVPRPLPHSHETPPSAAHAPRFRRALSLHSPPLHAHRPQVRKLEHDLVERFKGLAEERQTRRSHVDAVLDGLRARFTDTDDILDRQRREVQEADRRRLDDMELVEKAVASVQEQVRRLDERVTSGFRNAGTELRRLQVAGRRTGSELSEVRAEAAAARAGVAATGAEVSHRFDSVSSVLRALTNAVAKEGSDGAGAGGGASDGGGAGAAGAASSASMRVPAVPPPVPSYLTSQSTHGHGGAPHGASGFGGHGNYNGSGTPGYRW